MCTYMIKYNIKNLDYLGQNLNNEHPTSGMFTVEIA